MWLEILYSNFSNDQGSGVWGLSNDGSLNHQLSNCSADESSYNVEVRLHMMPLYLAISLLIHIVKPFLNENFLRINLIKRNIHTVKIAASLS